MPCISAEELADDDKKESGKEDLKMLPAEISASKDGALSLAPEYQLVPTESIQNVPSMDAQEVVQKLMTKRSRSRASSSSSSSTSSSSKATEKKRRDAAAEVLRARE